MTTISLMNIGRVPPSLSLLAFTLPFAQFPLETTTSLERIDLALYILQLTSSLTFFTLYPFPYKTVWDVHCHQKNRKDKQNGNLQNKQIELLSVVYLTLHWKHFIFHNLFKHNRLNFLCFFILFKYCWTDFYIIEEIISTYFSRYLWYEETIP